MRYTNSLRISFIRQPFKWSHQYSVDDVFQVAGIGLTKAYNSYDVDKDILFMTYLATIVNNEIRMYHYKNEKHVGVKSLDSPIGEHPTLLIDMLADNTDYEEIAVENINKVWINNLCKKLIEHLNSREKKIIKYRFMDGLALRKIGEKVGISGSRIGQIIDSCIAKMKIYYESEEFNVNENWYALIIASQFPVTVEQAFKILDRGKNFTKRKDNYTKFTKEELQQMEKLKSKGYTYRQIGELYGISLHAAYDRIKRIKKEMMI